MPNIPCFRSAVSSPVIDGFSTGHMVCHYNDQFLNEYQLNILEGLSIVAFLIYLIEALSLIYQSVLQLSGKVHIQFDQVTIVFYDETLLYFSKSTFETFWSKIVKIHSKNLNRRRIIF